MTQKFYNISSFLQHLMSGTRKELPTSREWEGTAESLRATDCGPQEVTEEDYCFFLELLPPRWIRGSHFIFAEGATPSGSFGKRTTGTSPGSFRRQRQISFALSPEPGGIPNRRRFPMKKNHDALMERLTSALDELADLRLVFDELLHILRTVQRDGLGVYDADAHWFAEGAPRPAVAITSMPKDPCDPRWAEKLNRFTAADVLDEDDQGLPLLEPRQRDLF
jgi:hypothetical protein